jgi:hypothetical protein
MMLWRVQNDTAPVRKTSGPSSSHWRWLAAGLASGLASGSVPRSLAPEERLAADFPRATELQITRGPGGRIIPALCCADWLARFFVKWRKRLQNLLRKKLIHFSMPRDWL